jgi:lipopolysaccharide heptosyltransferase II
MENDLDLIKISKILLWMPNWIGDVVLALPAVQALFDRYPEAKISIAVRAPSQRLLEGHAAIDTIYEIPSGDNIRFWDQTQFSRSLSKNNFDLGVAFPNSFKSAFLLRLTGAKYRLGYNTEIRDVFLTHSVEKDKVAIELHRVDYFLNILSPLKLKKMKTRFMPTVKIDSRIKAKEVLADLSVRSGEFLVAIHPGGSKLPRRWHEERFGVLCQKLLKEYDAKVILLGDKSESDTLKSIVGSCPADKVLCLTSLSLPETAAVISKCNVFIGNDSGMMHLAAMMNTPLVGIFGPGSPQTTGPFMDSDNYEIVTKNFPCSPCKQNFFKECKPSVHSKPYCIEDISVKDVMEAVERLVRIRGQSLFNAEIIRES